MTVRPKNPTTTIEILQPGDKFFNGKTIKEVPQHHLLLLCRLCNYYEALPTKQGRDFVADVRERHANNKHRLDLELGRLVL